MRQQPDPESEALARRLLLNYLDRIGQWDAEQVADFSLDLNGPRGRFDWYKSDRAEPALHPDESVLVSGMGAGSELLVALEEGAGYCAGLEVEHQLASVAKARLEPWKGRADAVVYNGRAAPFGDGTFDVVLSGHVIEHTPNPRKYLEDLVRVCRGGGAVLLEFPSRFQTREPHTGLVSFEWLPGPLRYLAYKSITWAGPITSAETKRRAVAILGTLRPVSLPQVRLWAWLAGGAVERHSEPAPGTLRCLIRKRRSPQSPSGSRRRRLAGPLQSIRRR